MSKVLLINPPTIETSPAMPLNLAYLAAVLENNNHEVKCIDYLAPYNDQDALTVAKEYQPDIIGFTLRIDSILEKYQFIKDLKDKYPQALYIAGGAHASCEPEEVLKYSGVNIVIIGEGEKTILDIANKKNVTEIPGCAYLDNGQIKYTAPAAPIADLDSIPFPAYHHFPLENYTKTNNPNFNRLFWSLFTSRGCPHACIFCVARNVYDRRYRFRSAENVFGEIKMLYEKYGVRHIGIQDDEPLINKQRMYELCEKLIQYDKGDLTFSARCRITSIDKDILNTMKKAGFNYIAYGIESGDDETLKKIKKNYTSAQISNGFAEIAKSELRDIHIGILVGFPWENWQNFKSNINMLKSIPKSVNYNFAIATLIPYPKTELYDLYKDEYGFQDWWLKGSPIKGYESGETFFGRNAPSLDILRAHNKNFWNFSIFEKMCLHFLAIRLEYIKLQSRHAHPILIIGLSLLSYYLSGFSVKLENTVFHIFNRFKLINN